VSGIAPPGFTGALIDRGDTIRQSPERLAEVDPQEDGQGQLVWGSMAEAPVDADLLFLGMEQGKPRFAAVPGPDIAIDARSRSCWRVLPFLAADQVALYGAARSLIDWHARHRFCANCGAPTVVAKGGWQRDCPKCAAQHFPRTDPVVIMLAEHDGSILVGRQHGWPDGRYSALAGFLEPGESLEEAVARELFEEAGVRAERVRYVASQPWPFPSSLMIGCIAEVGSRDLLLDATEIEAAMWVQRDEVAAAMRGDADARFIAPPPFAIAHSLFAHWLAQTAPISAN
jgi:NAD+ diphosphatase